MTDARHRRPHRPRQDRAGRALTGVNTDRLPEERERGISIELGYAPLELPSRAAAVGRRRAGPRALRAHDGRGRDRHRPVPDARRRRRRRDAADARARGGAARRCGVATGVVAVTKTDLADPERAAAEVAELLPGAEIVAGLGAHRRGARRAARGARPRGRRGARPRRRADGALRLHVDRVFTMRGVGTVVTGTLWSGAIGARRRRCASCRPGAERARALGAGARRAGRARRRGPARGAQPGRGRRATRSRAATWSSPATPGWRPPIRVDVALDAGAERATRGRGGARVHVHHGTRETPARVSPLEGEGSAGATGFAQLRLERAARAAGRRPVVILRRSRRPTRRRRRGARRPPAQTRARRASCWNDCARSSAGRSRRRPSQPPSRRARSPSRPRSTRRRCVSRPCCESTGAGLAPTTSWRRRPGCRRPRRGRVCGNS